MLNCRFLNKTSVIQPISVFISGNLAAAGLYNVSSIN